MPNHKRYLSTEVSVHQLEVEFVARFLEFDGALAELYYFLDQLPESLRPQAQKQKAQIQRKFNVVMHAAKLAGPIKRKPN